MGQGVPCRSHPHCRLKRRTPSLGAGLHREIHWGEAEELKEEPERARVHTHGLTLTHGPHTRARAPAHSCIHVHRLIHTCTCLLVHTETHMCAHTLSHDHVHTSTLALLHIKQVHGPWVKSRSGGDPLPGRLGLSLPTWHPQSVMELRASLLGGRPAGRTARGAAASLEAV